jgi:hypothetical protein
MFYRQNGEYPKVPTVVFLALLVAGILAWAAVCQVIAARLKPAPVVHLSR